MPAAGPKRQRRPARGWWLPARILAVGVLLIGLVPAGARGAALRAASVAAGSAYDASVLADHPVGFWDMSGAGGTEPDLTGRGHTGAYKGGHVAAASMPNGDAAVDLNGSSEYLTVPSSADFSIPTTGLLTFEGWIRPDIFQWTISSDPHGYPYVDWAGKCAVHAGSCEWESRIYDSVNTQDRCNRLSAYVFNLNAGTGSGAFWQPACNLLEAGQWLYVVAEYQIRSTPIPCLTTYPGTIAIWVNGIEWNMAYHHPTGCMSQYNVKPQAGTSPLNIGTMSRDTWFPGAVGKVAVYNYLLTQSQIDAHFREMTGAAPTGSCASICTIPVPTP